MEEQVVSASDERALLLKELDDLKLENSRLRAALDDWHSAVQTCGGFFKRLIGEPRTALLRELLGKAEEELKKRQDTIETIQSAACHFINSMGPSLPKIWKEYLHKHLGLTYDRVDKNHPTVIDKKT